MTGMLPKRPRMRLDPDSYKELCRRSWSGTTGHAKSVAQETIFRFTTSNFAVTLVMIQRRT